MKEMNGETPTITAFQTNFNIPNYVGGYRLGKEIHHMQFNLTYKPNWFHRTMVKLCLGWEWVNL